ncbi:AAA family ATPase [Streptomyces sp. NPDC020965]|uniref:AAA family ATPase n=1 Tax=Streptomyces sp. NPDC020965 TaxID=3365105 RepID=UPI00379294C9
MSTEPSETGVSTEASEPGGSTEPSPSLPAASAEKLTLFVSRLREELRADDTRAAPVADIRRDYRRAACLLTHFDPMLLRLPGEDHPTGGAVLELLDDCRTVGGKDHALWSLKSEIRDHTLRGLPGPDTARQALEANIGAIPDEQPGPERICLACLHGRPPPHTTDPYALADILQAVLWLSRVPGTTGLPDAAELQRTLERARLLQPLERLVRLPFQGRTRELDTLRRHVRAPLDPTGAPSRGLAIHGPGGMGKSTLLAKFLLDSIHDDTSGFPFAYIDFERPTLSVHEPITLIAEMGRQLAVQYPGHRAGLDALVEECQRTARSQREGQDRVTQLHQLATTRSVLGRTSSQAFQTLAAEHETALVRRLADILVEAVAEAGQGDAPFVVVIDSFEEAQYRASPVIGRMWAMNASFQSVYPRARIVVCGRAADHPMLPGEPPQIELTELDPAAAVGLLESNGVKDPTVARVLAERVGGHPLSLKLAARAAVLAASASASESGAVPASGTGSGAPGTGSGNGSGVTSGGTDELLRSLPARRSDEFFRRVDQMLVQGILYDRILHHIADRAVRQLARPGLVLRVITSDIIKEVLAEPCGLRVDTADEARRLFGELSRLDLVERVGPDAVRHRTDVRAIMLRLPGGDRTDVMRAVERRAVAYYAGRDGIEARAEEIYHRLRLDENPRTVEERWLPGVERLLDGAQQDMPHRAAGLLTAKLGGDTPDHVLAGADQEDWERITAREIEDLLAQGFDEAALVRLGERRPWTPCSLLHPLFVETLDRLGRREEARATVADAITGAREARCGERQLELLLLSARLSEDTGDLAAGERDLREAEDVAVSLGQDLEAMGALLARARLGSAAAAATASPAPVAAAAGGAGRAAAEPRAAQGAETPGQHRAPGGIPVAPDPASPSTDARPTPDAPTPAPEFAPESTPDAEPAPDPECQLALRLRQTPDSVLAGQPALVRAVASQVYVRDPAALDHALEVVGLPTDDEALETLGVAIRAAATRQPTLLGPLMTILRDAAGPPGPAAGTSPSDRSADTPSGSGPSSTTGILRLARDRGTIDSLARRLLAVPDESGEIRATVAAAMGAGTTGPRRAAPEVPS